jgi:hypothetical protein
LERIRTIFHGARSRRKGHCLQSLGDAPVQRIRSHGSHFWLQEKYAKIGN